MERNLERIQIRRINPGVLLVGSFCFVSNLAGGRVEEMWFSQRLEVGADFHAVSWPGGRVLPVDDLLFSSPPPKSSPHFTDKGAEAQRGTAGCWRCWALKPGSMRCLVPGSLCEGLGRVWSRSQGRGGFYHRFLESSVTFHITNQLDAGRAWAGQS